MISFGFMGAAWYSSTLSFFLKTRKKDRIFLRFLSNTCSVRVANELGRGDAEAVKFSIKVIMGTSVSIGLMISILCLVFSKKIGNLFTNDEEVVQSVADLSLLLSITVFLGSIYPILSGQILIYS